MKTAAIKTTAVGAALALAPAFLSIACHACQASRGGVWTVILPVILVSCAFALRWRYMAADEESAETALATDECIMRNYAGWAEQGFMEPTLRIYTHRDHSVLIGRYQNVDAEVHADECKALGITVNRRMTGSGAVLVGSRQLTITLSSAIEDPIVPAHPGRILQKLSKGITEGLAGLGIAAEFRPKNDISVSGRKIGGTALCIEEDGSFQYGATVLVDFDVPLMLRVLNVPSQKLADKGVSSYNQRITTVHEQLGRTVDMDTVRETIRSGFEKAFKITTAPIPLDGQELARVTELVQTKYSTPDWVHRREPTPDMVGEHAVKLPAGLLRVYVAMAGDTIKSLLITGDFVTGRAINDIEAALKWSRFDREAVRRTVISLVAGREHDIEGVPAPALADAICLAVENAKAADHTGILRRPISG